MKQFKQIFMTVSYFAPRLPCLQEILSPHNIFKFNFLRAKQNSYKLEFKKMVSGKTVIKN